jgi:hypothetical protein
MARGLGKLTALGVGRLRKKRLHADGGGLYVQISADGAKSWVFRFMLNGRARTMGLLCDRIDSRAP